MIEVELKCRKTGELEDRWVLALANPVAPLIVAEVLLRFSWGNLSIEDDNELDRMMEGIEDGVPLPELERSRKLVLLRIQEIRVE